MVGNMHSPGKKTSIVKMDIPFEEFKKRNERCRVAMRKSGHDAVLVFSDYFKHGIVRYLTGYTYQPVWLASSVYVLPLEGDPTLIIDRFMDEVRRQVWIDDVRACKGWLGRPGPPGTLAGVAKMATNVLREKGLEKADIGVVGFDVMPALFYEYLRKAAPEAKFEDVGELFERLRMTKTDNEIKALKRASKIIDAGMAAAVETIKGGISEREVATVMYNTLLSKGADFILAIWVVSGKAAEKVYRTPTVTNRRLEKGDMFWVDCGMAYKGYFADEGRTGIVGNPGEKQRDLCNAVLEMHRSAVQAAKPGGTADEIFYAAQKTAKESGYGRYFLGGFMGHGIGVSLDEYPLIVPGEETVIRTNMVINIDPKLFVPGIGGCRIEDTYLITEDGAKRLTSFKQKLW